MSKFLDKTGMTFDQLTVVKYVGRQRTKDGRSKGSLFECVCSCGNVVVRPTSNLRIYDIHGTNCGSCKVVANKQKEGKVFKSKNYGDFVVIEYKTSKEVVIKFLKTSYVTTVSFRELKEGRVKDPYYPSVYGVGYCGVGPYPLSYSKKGKKSNTPAYEAWLSRMKSCYGESKSSHLYVGATVCDEWHNFQNFAKWYYDQPFSDKFGYHLDKDLTIVGNQVYSPEACKLIPPCINTMGIFRISEKFGRTSSGKWRHRVYETRKPSRSYETKEECEKAYILDKNKGLKNKIKSEYLLGNITEEFYEHLTNLVEINYPLGSTSV